MDESDLFNSVSDQLSSEEMEILNLHYELWFERQLREQDKERYEKVIKKLRDNNLPNYLKKSLGYSKLERSIKKTKTDFNELGIKTDNTLFWVCAVYDVVESLLSRKY